MSTTYAYGPFGNTQLSGTADPNPFQYAGRENDGTGLYFNRARYYSPEHGRFISEDPIGHASGDTNLYSYAANSPTNATDPSGLCAGGMNGLSLATDMLTIAWDLHTRVNQLAAASMAQGWDPYAFADEVIAAGNAAQVDAAISAAAHCVPFAMAAIPGGAGSRGAVALDPADVVVIGKLDDLNATTLRPGERTLLSQLDRGSARLNYLHNDRVLRTEMRRGVPIRDVSINPATGALVRNTGFLRAERNILDYHRWRYDPNSGYWYAPR